MELWSAWLGLIADSISFLSASTGMSSACAVIAFTLLARALLLPISYRTAYCGYKNKAAIVRARPEIERLKKLHGNDGAALAQATMALYKKRGIRFFNKTFFVNIGAQSVLGLGTFQALKSSLLSAKFLWIADIAKPDVILSFVVGLLTYACMLLMPGTVEQSSLLLFLIFVEMN